MQELEPAGALLQMASGLWLSRAIWCAAKLRIADAIGDGPADLHSIARETGTDPDHLRRLLNALAAFGVFSRAGEDRFGQSPLSEALRSDRPGSQRAFVESVFGGEHYEAWGALDETLRTGRTAFDVRFGTPVFDYFGAHPETARLFGEAMTSTTAMVQNAVLAARDFGPFELAVDVGGSEGSLLRALLARQPNARGIVFDLPDQAEAGRRAWSQTPDAGRMQAVGGDFFESVPEGGDLYLLKSILHDWTDAQCARILANIRAAIRPQGRVAIFELVLPDEPAPHLAWLMDLNMMTMTGGRERTAAEHRQLLEQAGFRMDRLTPTASPVSIIEAVPV